MERSEEERKEVQACPDCKARFDRGILGPCDRHYGPTRRAMEMNAELPQATYDLLKLKGMI